MSFIFTASPVLRTSSTFSTLCHSNSEICTIPSRPGANSTKAPKDIIRVTLPSNSIPTSGSNVIPFTISKASLHFSVLAPAIVTRPSSSTFTSHSVFLPPGPIRAPIFSGLMLIDIILGAY